MTDLVLDRKPEAQTKFSVVGIISSEAFQKCRFITEKLHKSFPKKYSEPEIRPMLNLAWDEYLTKMKRRFGKKFYLLFEPAVVYVDGEFLGDSRELFKFVRRDYVMETNVDFQTIASQSLISYFENIVEKYKRKFVYLTVAIDDRVLGAMLFQLYNDLVPETCENFMSNCINRESGYRGTRVHRIANSSFVQCGGFNLKGPRMACENYSVPHDRRGVLSMCNYRRHRDNSTQFFITLEATSWMDYKYVAFGQLIQGAEILRAIERISTYHQNPVHKILIVNCGEFSLCPKPDDEDYLQNLNPFDTSNFGRAAPDFAGDVDVDAVSVIDLAGFKSGKYFLPTDLVAYAPFKRYSTMFIEYLQKLGRTTVDFAEVAEEAGEKETDCAALCECESDGMNRELEEKQPRSY